MGKIYDDVQQQGTPEQNKNNPSILLNMGSLVVGRDDVMYRDNEINRIYNIMDKTSHRAVMLVGDTGSGKRSIVEGYMQKIKDNYRNEYVVEIDFDELIKQTHNADFSQVVNTILDTAAHNEAVGITLMLSNIGYLLNINCYGNAGFAFINAMMRYIENDDLQVIITATTDEYKIIEDSFKKVIDTFTVIKLTELTKEQTIEISKEFVDFYGDVYDMTFPDNICELICDNADKYIKNKPFPGKVDELFDEVCAGASNRHRCIDSKIVKILGENEHIKEGIKKSLESNDLITCEELKKKLQKNIDRANKIDDDTYTAIDLTETDILEEIGKIVDVNITKLSKDQTKFLKDMPNEIKKYVIGQNQAVDMVVKNIRRNKLGLRKTRHSAGNFMFIGSTGVGKTYLAKQLAKYLYGSEENLLRLDMSEFQNEIDVSKLLGSAPGYVGYKESGLLVKGLAKKPETVVLFDEIEKAHQSVYNVLLQLLDEGFITGSDGKKVDASKALIIFTSNIGVRQAQEMSNPLGFSNNTEKKKNENKEKIIRQALKKRFSPEFLNRLDNICYFNSLDSETLKSILHKELEESNKKIKTLTGKTVVLSPEVEKWVLDKVENEDNGARPVIRILQQNIEETIADMIINEDKILDMKKKTLTAKLVNDEVVIK